MINRILDLEKINNAIKNFSKETKEFYNDYLINEFGSLFSFHSNRIEGTNKNLSLNDTRDILNSLYKKDINNKDLHRQVKETINHQDAFKYILNIKNEDINIIEVIKKIHKIVGKDVIENAGNYKNNENYMLLSSGREISFTHPDKVANEMNKLQELYYGSWQNLTVYERAAHLHMGLVNIHPFSDGNGRVARLIMKYKFIKL